MRVKIFFLMKGQAFINANRKNHRFGIKLSLFCWHSNPCILAVCLEIMAYLFFLTFTASKGDRSGMSKAGKRRDRKSVV